MTRPRRRPRIIGPFFLIAIVLSAGVFLWQKQQRERQLADVGPPVVERQVIDAPEADSVPPPDLVLAQAAKLGLTPSQRQRLDPLVQAYGKDLRPLQEQLQAATQRFAAYQQAQQGRKQVPVADIQSQMAEISELSGLMVSLRRSYWQQIAPILTAAQETRARELWRQSLMPAKGQ